MTFRPVVFDCDGVLVDSEELGWAATAAVLRRYGVEVTAADRAALAGTSFADDYAHFAARASLPGEGKLWEEIAGVIADLFDSRLQAFEDARDTLDDLRRRGVRMAVASNSPRDRLDVSLRATQLAELFEASVSAEDVAAAKPAPDIYVEAARLLGVDPADCVAVEDTPTGIRAAKDAGMTVVAVERGEHSAAELHEADRIVPRLTPAALLHI